MKKLSPFSHGLSPSQRFYRANMGTSLAADEFKPVAGECDWCHKKKDELLKTGAAHICNECKKLEMFMLGD